MIPMNSPDSYALAPGLEMCDTLEFTQALEIHPTRMRLLKPFGVVLSENSYRYNNLDNLECIQRASQDLPSILASMPQTNEGEVKLLTDLLLGPPTIEAAQRCKY